MTRRKHRDNIETGQSRWPARSLAATCLVARRCPALRWRELGSGSGTERGNLAPDTAPGVQLGITPPAWRERGPQVAETTRGRVATQGPGADRLVVATKALCCAVLVHDLARWAAALGGLVEQDEALVVAAPLRTRYFAVPACLVNRSGRPTLRVPKLWPRRAKFCQALTDLRALAFAPT